MKLILPLMLLAAVCASSAFSQSGEKSKSVNPDLEIEVMATVQMWADAVVKRDLKTLDLIFSPDLIITTSDGNIRGKREELEALKPNPDIQFVSVANENVRIRFYGKTAVVTALTKMVFNIKGRETTGTLVYTAVFVKEDRRWQMVALQTARPPQAVTPKTD